MIRKNFTNAFAISLALTTGIGITVLPQSLPEASAAEESTENIYPSDKETEDSWKWTQGLTCDDLLDDESKEKLKELGDLNNRILNSSSPEDLPNYEYPTEEELNNLEESSWDAPGDYSYLVENNPEGQRPKLMKVKGKDKYFIASSYDESERDPEVDKKYFYRLFKPEDYLPKEMVEWKTDPEYDRKYNAKLFNGFADNEEYFPYGDGNSYAKRKKLKSEFMPDKGLSLSERLDYFMENDDIFSIDTSYYKNRHESKIVDGKYITPSRWYNKDPETGETVVDHDDQAFATCGPLVSIKPYFVSNIGKTPVLTGSKDLAFRESDYLPPSDNGLTLRKTNDSDKLLSGSSWKIKNLGTKEEFTVTDNKKPDNNDKNTLEDLYKEDGLINVDLPEGRYELVETEAPEGYEIDNTPRKFIVHDRTGASFGMGAIVNEPETPDDPDTPDTPNKPDTPDTPNKPDTPDTPNKPDTPDTPHESDTPESPKTPDNPSESTTPSNPDTPDTLDTTDAPIVSPVQPANRKPFTPVSTVSPYQPRVASDKTTPLVEEDVVEGVKVNTGGKVEKNTFFSKVLSVFV